MKKKWLPFTKVEKGLPSVIRADDVQGVEVFERGGATLVAILLSGGHTIDVAEGLAEVLHKLGIEGGGEKQ